jgi:ATP-binding cassette subfamily B protein
LQQEKPMARDSRILAVSNGNSTKARDTALLQFETCIDLEGHRCSEQFSVDDHTLIVSKGTPGTERRWRLDEIDGFRVEPGIGSCFVQARMAGHWIDLLRCPGGADPQLTASIAQLNSLDRDGDFSGFGPPSAGQQRAFLSRGDARPRNDADPQPTRTAVRLFSLLHPSFGTLLLLFALSAAAVVIEVAPPLLQGVLVDRVLTTNGGQHPSPQMLFLLLAIVTGLLLVRLAGTIVGVWKGYVSSHAGASMTADLRAALVKKLNSLPLAFHDRSQVGALMSQVAYDTETLHTLIYHITGGLLLQGLQLVGISIAMFWLNPKLAAVTLLPMPLILAGSWYFTRHLQPRQHHYWEAVGKQASALMGMLSGIRVVKAFVQEDREIRRFEQASRRLRDSRLTVDVSTSMFTAAIGMLFAIGGLAVWYIGGRDVLFGRMTLGSLMAFFMYLAMFYAPLTSIAESTAWFANFFGTSRRLCDVLDAPGETETPRSKVSLGRVRGRVELERVSFGYDKNRPVLKDVSFAIGPGQMVGVVGRSGSGKSTLVSLIGRLYDADSGQIRVDGMDVQQIKRQDLRRQIGMVPQDSFLFRGTIAENIAYGNTRATPEQILVAAKQADAHDFIMEMPLAYSTQLREGGTGLSGGERQRLSIARALLFDPAILILDEATSNVDAESERAICRTVRRWARQRTAIVISHRLSTLRGADWLLVFDQGRLVEQGTQESLIAQGGIYSTLASIQGDLTDIRQRLEATVGAAAVANVESAIGSEDDGDAFLSSTSPMGRSFLGTSETDGQEKGDDEIHWFDPSEIMVENGPCGTLSVISSGERSEDVYAVRAFPTDHERQYVSLRRREQAGRPCELGMIGSLDRWPRSAQEGITRSLGRRYLFRRILEIRQICTSENVLALSVETDSGPAMVRLEKPGEGSQPFRQNGLLLTDSTGNYFVMADRNAIPKWQQRLLTLYFGD